MIRPTGAPQTIRVGSYNVKNMFLQEDLTPDSHTRPKSDWSMEALNRVIRKTDADVLALQELSSEKTLKKFMKDHGLDKIYPHVGFVKGNDQRGINVGIISKYPMEVTSHKDTRFPLADGSGQAKFSRDLLRADLELDGKPGADFTIYTTHCKSRRPADPGETPSDVRRLSEGQAIRDIVEREMKPFPDRLFVVTGDFNDNTNDPTVQAVLNPKNGEPWLDSLDHLPEKERNTWPANPNAGHGHDPEQFDHIIYPKSKDDQLLGSQVHRYTKDDPYDWLSSSASDHLNITADFKLK